MRLRSGVMPGVDRFMMLLLLKTEADCLDQQHRRTSGAANSATRNSNGAGAPTAIAV
jgi:hypothetical protein